MRAAVELPALAAGGGCDVVFAVGFCFGGRHAWLATAERPRARRRSRLLRVDRASGTASRGRPQRAAELVGADPRAAGAATTQSILPEHNAAFDAGAARPPGVEHELVVYDGAPHSFFDRRFEEHADASADAWERTLAFIERHTPA